MEKKASIRAYGRKRAKNDYNGFYIDLVGWARKG
jgi:hypothetical protein